jgi:hypothetical protein
MAEELPIAEFLQFFQKKFDVFLRHHCTMKWQQQDWA